MIVCKVSIGNNKDIVLSERDYKRLLESRNAFASTLAALVELGRIEPEQCEQVEERRRLLALAENQLDQYGQDQAFVIL